MSEKLMVAIAAVSRGDSKHDEARKALIARAAEQKLDVVPDNWSADGSLREAASTWATDEQRETYDDRRRTVESAISEALPKDDDGDCAYCWVNDLTDDWAVYEYDGELWQISYSIIAGGEVTLGKPAKVRRVTTYEANAAQLKAETRELQDGMEVCPTCGGDGTDDATCETCEGTGEVEAGTVDRSSPTEVESRKVSTILNGTIERRDFTASDVEIRSTSDGGLRFSGYASTTETPYQVGAFEETFAKGAFKRCLGEEPDVVLLVNHTGLPLARTRSGTMTLSEDTRGLKVDADLDPTDPDVQSLLPKMKRGDLTEMSFAFRATDDEWDSRETKRVVRAATIHKGDVSMVTHGANTATSGTVAMRSADGAFELRIDEARIGKALSNEKKAKLEAIKGEINDILGTPDEPVVESLPSDPLATIIPSGIEAARAAKARAERRAA